MYSKYSNRNLMLALALAAIPLFILYILTLIVIHRLVQCHLITSVAIPPYLGCSTFS